MAQTTVPVLDAVNGAWKPRAVPGDLFVSNGEKWLPAFVPPDSTAPTTPTTPVPTTSFTDLPGLVAFMDAANPGATYANKAEVGTWKASGSDQVFSQTAATAYPTYRTATADDPAHVRFDGANDRLIYDGNLIPATGSFTLYAVVRLQQLGYGTIFNQGSTTTTVPTTTFDVTSSGGFRALRRTDDNVLTQSPTLLQVANVWRVISIVSPDYSAVTVRSNEATSTPGQAATTSTSGTSTTTTTSLGMRLSAAADTVGKYDVPFLGDIAAIVVYQGAHDAARVTSVEQQLATRYGITGVLPSKGGTVNGPTARQTASRLERSVEYGIPATNRVTGRPFPNFTTAGVKAGVAPVPQTGGFTSTSENQVVENKWFIGAIKINHSGVVFRNCIIYNTTDPKIDCRGVPSSGVPFRLENCEVFGRQDDEGTGIGYGRYTAVDCFFHDCEDEFRLGVSVTITRCVALSHSNGYLTEAERLHTDSIQSNGITNGDTQVTKAYDCVLIARRRNLTKGNSAVIIASEGASINGVNQGSPVRHVVIEGCYLSNGSYSLYFKTPGEPGSPGPFEDITVKDNVFATVKDASGNPTSASDAQYGAVIMPRATMTDEYLTFTGNLMEDGSAVTITRWAAVDVQAPTANTAATIAATPSLALAYMDPSTRIVTVNWKLPAIGPLTIVYTDSTGLTQNATAQGLKSKYVLAQPVPAGATSFTVTISTSAGSLSTTVNPQ